MPKEKTTSLKARINTFQESGLGLSHPNTNAFAFAGFSKDMTSTASDSVLCDFCNKALESWHDSDIPIQEHRKHANYCPLFQIHTVEGRIQTFRHGNNPFGGVATKTLATEGMTFYAIDENMPMIFCVNCDFVCQAFGPSSMFMATPRIRELHAWHNVHCKDQRDVIDANPARSKEIYSSEKFFYRVLAGMVDISKITKYTIRLDHGTSDNIRMETDTWEEYMSTGSLPNREKLYEKKESQDRKSSIVQENRSMPQKRKISESQSTLETKNNQSPNIPQKPAHHPEETEKHAHSTSIKNEIDVSSFIEIKASAIDRLMKGIAEIPDNIAQRLEKLPEENEENIRLVRPEGIVTQLSTFISDEERNTLPIKKALLLGLSRMMEQIRQITSQDIENVRLDILGLFR